MVWNLDQSDGELLVRTGVAGPAAKMGHRLTIAMQTWHAEVHWDGDTPTAVDLAVEVDSLQVQSGEGGVTPLTPPERVVARANALKALEQRRYPQIRFHAEDITATDGGYRLSGSLQIHGQTRDCVVELGVEDLGDEWSVSCEQQVRQTDFGVKPYSLAMGTLKVADVVTVSFTAQHSK